MPSNKLVENSKKIHPPSPQIGGLVTTQKRNPHEYSSTIPLPSLTRKGGS
jgi:hypothetical protein